MVDAEVKLFLELLRQKHPQISLEQHSRSWQLLDEIRDEKKN